MNGFTITLGVLVILVLGCRKREVGSASATMQVLEYKSQVPISDGSVNFYKSKLVLGQGFPYFEDVLFKTGTTDANGNFTTNKEDFEDASAGITLSKTNYWRGKGGEGKRYMSTEAYVNLHLVKTNNAPDYYFMTLWVEGEIYKGLPLSFRQPIDSTVGLRAFGDETSTYFWVVAGTPLSCSNPPCLIDTVARGTFQVKIAKGVTISYNLNY